MEAYHTTEGPLMSFPDGDLYPDIQQCRLILIFNFIYIKLDSIFSVYFLLPNIIDGVFVCMVYSFILIAK
jgi:hypothetical protein